jgi:hypothetical protein
MDEGQASSDSVSRFGKARVPKQDAYNWERLDSQGEFSMIEKGRLNVDHQYQRDNISKSRVLVIAAYFSWIAFGVLVVGRRSDGTLWVVDGQHRKLAADRRSDVTVLPCLVFDMEEIKREAQAFLAANTVRGPVKTLDKFRALVLSGEVVAIAVQSLVSTTGHRIGGGNGRDVRCVAKLMQCMRTDAQTLRIVWPMSVEICNGSAPSDDIIGGLFVLERHLHNTRQGSIADVHNRQTLVRRGLDEIRSEVRKAVAYHGGGDFSCAEGICNAINYGRSTRRINFKSR